MFLLSREVFGKGSGPCTDLSCDWRILTGPFGQASLGWTLELKDRHRRENRPSFSIALEGLIDPTKTQASGFRKGPTRAGGSYHHRHHHIMFPYLTSDPWSKEGLGVRPSIPADASSGGQRSGVCVYIGHNSYYKSSRYRHGIQRGEKRLRNGGIFLVPVSRPSCGCWPRRAEWKTEMQNFFFLLFISRGVMAELFICPESSQSRQTLPIEIAGRPACRWLVVRGFEVGVIFAQRVSRVMFLGHTVVIYSAPWVRRERHERIGAL